MTFLEGQSGEVDTDGCNALYFWERCYKRYKRLVGFSQRNNVKLGIYVFIQGLDVLLFNRKDHKPHVFLTIGSTCKEYEMKSV